MRSDALPEIEYTTGAAPGLHQAASAKPVPAVITVSPANSSEPRAPGCNPAPERNRLAFAFKSSPTARRELAGAGCPFAAAASAARAR